MILLWFEFCCNPFEDCPLDNLRDCFSMGGSQIYVYGRLRHTLLHTHILYNTHTHTHSHAHTLTHTYSITHTQYLSPHSLDTNTLLNTHTHFLTHTRTLLYTSTYTYTLTYVQDYKIMCSVSKSNWGLFYNYWFNVSHIYWYIKYTIFFNY